MRDQICIVDAHVKRLELAQQNLLGKTDLITELDVDSITVMLGQIKQLNLGFEFV